MAATLAMERSKRQIKPNLTRTDFGYVERTRPINKQPKKPKLMEEDEGGGGGGDARNLTVDFSKLDMATLKRYKRHYRLKTRQNVTKTELAVAVARHFASQAVDEARRPSARPPARPPVARPPRPPASRPRSHAASPLRAGRHHLPLHVLGARGALRPARLPQRALALLCTVER